MTRTTLNLNYCKGRPYEYFGANDEALPASYAIVWLMMATRVNRIFTREDMKEFLFRTAILLDKKELTETWLMEDRLTAFEFHGQRYYLTLEDVSSHVGIEVHDVVDNLSPREAFYKSLKEQRKELMYLSLYYGCNIVLPERQDEKTIAYPMSEIKPVLTPELIEKAEFFAADVLAQMPAEAFEDEDSRMAEKTAELNERRKAISAYPVFNIANYTDDVLRELCVTIFGEKDAEYYLSEKEDFDRMVVPWIHLAFLFANDLMDVDELTAYPKEGTPDDLDIDFFDDGGINLLESYRAYELDRVAHLLKV